MSAEADEDDVSSTVNTPVNENKCRSDNPVKCSRNVHVEICDIQLCDGVADCPDSEDEDDCSASNYYFII